MLESAYSFIIGKLQTQNITCYSNNIPSSSPTQCVAIRATASEPQYTVTNVLEYLTYTFNIYIKGNESTTTTNNLCDTVQSTLHLADDKCFVTEPPVYAYTDDDYNDIMIMRVAIIKE